MVDAPERPPLMAIVGLLVVLFLAAIDATIVGTAMPKVIAVIGGMDLYPWAFSGFMLTSTVVMPFYGKFADIYGSRRCLFVAIALFLLGSVLCGAATTMPQLVGFRALQGLGAGGVTTLTMIAFGQLFRPETRGKAQGLVSMVWGVSSLVGPLTGGFVVDHFPWPWIFWINLPVGLLATACIAIGMPRHLGVHRPHRIAWGQATLLVAGLLAMMVALTATEPWLRGGLPLGIAALGVFVAMQSRSVDPLVPLAALNNRVFATAATLGFASCVTMFAALSYVPLYVQGVLGRSAQDAGVVLTPMMVAWPLAGAAAGLAVNRLGFRALVVAGAAVQVVGYVLLMGLTPETPAWRIAADASLLGLGMGLITATSLISAQVGVVRAHIGAASSTLALVRNLGAALGLNLIGGLQLADFASRLQAGAQGLPADLAARLSHPQMLLQHTEGDGVPAALTALVTASMDASLRLTFTVSAAIAVACLAAACWMPALSPKAAADQAEAARG